MMDVLVPVDDSEQSREALRYAREAFPDCEITAIHVIPTEGYWATFAEDSEEIPRYDEAREHAEGMLTRARDDVDGVVETRVVVGQPAREIVEAAEEGGFDAIVIGSHGRTGAARVLLGSVAEAVARRSPVPVTIVR